MRFSHYLESRSDTEHVASRRSRLWGVEQLCTTPIARQQRARIYRARDPSNEDDVRLATGASVTVMKRVVRITYTLKGVQYNDEFIILDLDDKFDVILGLP